METSTSRAAGLTRTPARGWVVGLLSRFQVSSIILTSYTFGVFLPFIRQDLPLSPLEAGLLQSAWWIIGVRRAFRPGRRHGGPRATCVLRTCSRKPHRDPVRRGSARRQQLLWWPCARRHGSVLRLGCPGAGRRQGRMRLQCMKTGAADYRISCPCGGDRRRAALGHEHGISVGIRRRAQSPISQATPEL